MVFDDCVNQVLKFDQAAGHWQTTARASSTVGKVF